MVLVPEGRQIFVSDHRARQSADGRLYCAATATVAARRRGDIYDRFPNLGRSGATCWPRVLSGGEQQMLAISRALLSKPKLMMLDEPSLGLSPLFVAADVRPASPALNRDGLAILLVEQNTHMALDIARRGYVLELGHVTLQGEAAMLAADPALAAAYLGAHA